MDWKRLQTEHREWLDRVFPGQTDPRYPALGLVEEAGELVHALLKSSQEQIWGKELRYVEAKWSDALVDAVGDCAIFAVSLCNTNLWDFNELMTQLEDLQAQPMPAFDRAACIVDYAICILRTAATAKDLLVHYLANLELFAQSFGSTVAQCVEATWPEVRTRGRACA